MAGLYSVGIENSKNQVAWQKRPGEPARDTMPVLGPMEKASGFTGRPVPSYFTSGTSMYSSPVKSSIL